MLTEEEQRDMVEEWRLEMLLEVVGGDGDLALKLFLHDADYRKVGKAVKGGATREEIVSIFC